MAERWVIGFAVDAAALSALVGSKRPAAEIIELAGGSDDVDELLAERGDPITAAAAIAQITAGELDDERAYEYRRCLELVACAAGRRLGGEIDVVLTYYLTNDSHGRWDPVLESLGLETLARRWGESTPFPWTDKPRADWPIAMLLSADEAVAAAAELEALDPVALIQLPDEDLVETGDHDEAGDTRDELRAGFATLAAWLTEAIGQQRGLLMIMDGSQ